MEKKKMIEKIAKGVFLSVFVMGGFACSSEDDPGVSIPSEKKLFAGADISSLVTIQNNSELKKATIQVKENGSWKFFPILPSGKADFENPMLIGYTAGNFELNNSVFRQYCFEWEENNRCVIANRQLPMEGQPNCRDLGGYKTQDGKYIKWGVIFRSGHLNELTDADLSYLSSIPLKTIIDFRTEEEKTNQPDRVPTTVKKRLEYTVESGNTSTMQDFIDRMMAGDYEYVRQTLIDANAAFVDEYQEVFRSFFTAVLEEENLPVLYHCTAGKDRAGFASAMFLAALGVEKETILNDYLLTNTMTGASLEEDIRKYGENLGKAMYYVNSVQLEYINNAFKTIETKYGTVEKYLIECLQVDIEKLRRIYLY